MSRTAVHRDAIGALASVRPGMVLSGGRDKVQIKHYNSCSKLNIGLQLIKFNQQKNTKITKNEF